MPFLFYRKNMRSFAFYVHDFHFGRRGDNLNFVVLVVIGNIVFCHNLHCRTHTKRKHIFRLERYVDSMSHLRRLEDAQPISDKSNISGYVTAIADSARILCEQSGKTLSIQNNISDIPIGIDYTFVSQVNNNLISNAIRYATSKVNITYTSNNDGFYLSVSDNGCGFSKNILSKATNPYFTEEENHSEHFGLGLYICKILCEHHGGYLKIENCSIGAKVTAFFKSLD